MTIAYIPSGETLLSGPVEDQVALHGILGKARDLNLTLISATRAEPGPPQDTRDL
jgi:hypothetical protein